MRVAGAPETSAVDRFSRDVERAFKGAADTVDQIEFDPHWFRRAFHAFGSISVLYFLLPDTPLLVALKQYLPGMILIVAAGLEAYRANGAIRDEDLFALRDYERRRVGSYLYFTMSMVILVYAFPQWIAVPCILIASFVDPVMGEVKRANSDWRVAGLAGLVVTGSICWLSGYHPLLSLLVGAAAVAGEGHRIEFLDDDLLVPMIPAFLLLLLASLGVLTAAGLTHPDVIFPTRLGVPSWVP
jgi:dolichol kinase